MMNDSFINTNKKKKTKKKLKLGEIKIRNENEITQHKCMSQWCDWLLCLGGLVVVPKRILNCLLVSLRSKFLAIYCICVWLCVLFVCISVFCLHVCVLSESESVWVRLSMCVCVFVFCVSLLLQPENSLNAINSPQCR